MKKKLLILLCSVIGCIALAFGFAACNKGGSGGKGGGGDNGSNNGGEQTHVHQMTHHDATATCTESGTIEYWYCGKCHKNFSDEAGTQEVSELFVSALGHDYYINNQCRRCGSLMKYTQGLKYTLNDDGETWRVTGKGEATDTDIIIPYTYEGKTVTSIGDSAFYYFYNLTSITIPNSVTSIGDWAFQYCNGLTRVTIVNGVTSIGDWAFYGCSGLTGVKIGNGVTSVGRDAFAGCNGLECITVDENNLNCASQDGILYNKAKTEFIHIPQAIKGAVTIPNGVTNIRYGAFQDRSKLTSVTIPNGVTSIGSDAFSGCSGLTGTLTIPNGVTSIGDEAFYGCSKLESITIPDSVTNIGRGAFSGCSGLTGTLTIPNGVTRIGDSTFYNCSGLTSVTIPNSVTSIGHDALSGCGSLKSVTLPFVGDSKKTASSTYQYPFGYIFGTSSYTGGVETTQRYVDWDISYKTNKTYYIPTTLKSVTVTGGNILYGAFYNCSGLTSVTIGNGVIVMSVGRDAFAGCSGLERITVDENNPNCASQDGILYNKAKTELFYIPQAIKGAVTIPNGVTSIGGGAFRGCSGLTSVTIPNSVTEIGHAAFNDCSSLTSVTIGNSVTSIGEEAFYNCSGLTSVTIPNSVKSIGEGAFAGCNQLTRITIPNSVKSIGGSAFSGCSGLTSVTIPNSVTSIGEKAFLWCDGLTSVTILNGVTSIGYGAFAGCSGLTSVTIPNSVTSIEDEVFWFCDNLTSVTIPDGVMEIGDGAFGACCRLVEIYNKSALTIQRGSYGADYLLNVYTEEGGSKLTKSGDFVIYNGDTLVSYEGNQTQITIPNGIKRINDFAFYNCSGLTSVTIGNSVTSIGVGAFAGCSRLISVTFEDTSGWKVSKNSDMSNAESLSASDLDDSAIAAKFLILTYDSYYWKRS